MPRVLLAIFSLLRETVRQRQNRRSNSARNILLPVPVFAVSEDIICRKANVIRQLSTAVLNSMAVQRRPFALGVKLSAMHRTAHVLFDETLSRDVVVTRPPQTLARFANRGFC